MVRQLLVLLTASGCGRMGYDPLADVPADAALNGPGPDADPGPGLDADRGPPCSAGALLADSAAGFGSVQGGAGWTYGYLVAPFTSADFRTLPVYSSAGSRWEFGTGEYWTSVAAGSQHPNGTNGNQGRLPVEHWVSRRWTSDARGQVRLTGSAQRLAGSYSGVNVIVRHDGIDQVLLTLDTWTPGAIDLPLRIAAGSILEFIVEPRMHDDVNDSTGLAVQITCLAP